MYTLSVATGVEPCGQLTPLQKNTVIPVSNATAAEQS